MMPPDAYPETPKRWSPLKRWLLIGIAVIAGGLITAELVIRPLVETESGPPPPGQDKQLLALIPAVSPSPPPASLSEAAARHPIRFRGGAGEADIRAVYGEPEGDVVLQNFRPATMHILHYTKLGLRFNFNMETLYGIDVCLPFQGEVFGMRLGDPIERALAVFGPPDKTFEPGIERFGRVTAYRWNTDPLQNWTFYTYADRIVAVHFYDEAHFGKWTQETWYGER